MLNVIALIIGESIFGSGPSPVPGFPCVITNGQTFVVSVDATTDCDPLTINNGGTLTINNAKFLTILSPPDVIDPDAQAYLNAVVDAGGTIDGTIETATNTLFVGLKEESLYSLLDCMYPVIGGTAASHKFNAVNPLNTDAAFRLGFTAGWTHGPSGMQSNGGSGTFAESYYDASLVVGTSDNQHVSIYTTTASNRNIQDIGSTVTSPGVIEVGLYTSVSGNQFFPNVKAAAAAYPPGFVQPTQGGIGYFIATSTGTNVLGQKNGVLVTNAVQAPAFTDKQHYIGNTNGNQGGGSPQNIIFATFGRKLTSGQMTTLSNLVNAFQTALGRNTY